MHIGSCDDIETCRFHSRNRMQLSSPTNMVDRSSRFVQDVIPDIFDCRRGLRVGGCDKVSKDWSQSSSKYSRLPSEIGQVIKLLENVFPVFPLV